MREIIFRGKPEDGGWIYDSCIYIDEDYAAIDCIPVDINTVGQFTGFRDCNGVGIYEGDIVRLYVGNDRDSFENDEVVFDKGCWVLKRLDLINGNDRKFLYVKVAFPANIEVIGNVHDNPEFVKGE